MATGIQARTVSAVWVLAAIAACATSDRATAPERGRPAFEVVDGAHGVSVQRFFFLPPLVAQPSPTGEFDAALAPIVTICAWQGTACGRVVAQFTTSDRGSERVRHDAGDQHYIVNWHTGRFGLDPAVTYRIGVLVREPVRSDAIELGHADVRVARGTDRREARSDSWITIADGRTLPIKFRIEEGIVGSVTVNPPTTRITEGEMQQLTAVVADLHGSTLADRVVTWSSSDPGVAAVDETGLVRGIVAGTVTMTGTSEGRSGSATVTIIPRVLPVIPGIEGFGTTTRAGRRGAVVRVTNLNEAGPGSLRAALEIPGPRVVIFEVSGTILLTDNLVVTEPFVTVAGQTAPSPGITLRGAALHIDTHDVLVQHLRIRVGDDPEGPDPRGRDGLRIFGADVHDVVADHMSVSWAIDENVSTSTHGVRRDITIINSIISEGLSHSLHPSGESSKGLLIGEGTQNISVLRNVFGHNNRRNPEVQGNSGTLIVNNLIYNSGRDAIEFNSGVVTSSVVGNVMVVGPNTSDFELIGVEGSVAPGTAVYHADNVAPRIIVVDPEVPFDPIVGSPPIWVSPLTVLPSGVVESHVLASAGARPADRDAVDERLIDEIRSRSGRIIDSQGEVGGWPLLAENHRPLTLPADPNGDDDGDGYTNLEEWLHQMAAAVERP